MSLLNYTTYTTYTYMSDAQERMLVSRALNQGRTVSLRESARNAVLGLEKVFLKLASYCRAAGKALAQARAHNAQITASKYA